MCIIAPSLLEADYKCLGEQFEKQWKNPELNMFI